MLSYKEFQAEVEEARKLNKVSYGFHYSNLTEHNNLYGRPFLYSAVNEEWGTVIGYSYIRHPSTKEYGCWIVVINFPIKKYSSLDFALTTTYLEGRHLYYPTLQEAIYAYE